VKGRTYKEMVQVDSRDPCEKLAEILKGHHKPLHYEILAQICKDELAGDPPSEWTVYNSLLSHPELFLQVDEDVFVTT
jgi:hypothetical protein